jgi:hypothetical protein
LVVKYDIGPFGSENSFLRIIRTFEIVGLGFGAIEGHLDFDAIDIILDVCNIIYDLLIVIFVLCPIDAHNGVLGRMIFTVY